MYTTRWYMDFVCEKYMYSHAWHAGVQSHAPPPPPTTTILLVAISQKKNFESENKLDTNLRV